jgi:type III pantothenate kinase
MTARPERIFVSCVSSQQDKQAFINFAQLKWQHTPEFLVSPAKGSGIINAYAEPSRLGSDRWAAMVAAYHATRAAVLVVDAGTALTIDAIDDQGQHRGGLIFPGLNLSLNLLEIGTQIEFTSDLTISGKDMFFGRSTETGIVSGARHAIGSLIDRAYNQLAVMNQSGAPVCHLTGGDAVQIKDALQCKCTLDPALVLKGLALIAIAL